MVNNAASGYVKALQHLMYGKDAYHASELSETNYADVVEALGCRGIRVESPDQIGASLRSAMQEKGRPTVLDVVVTRDPASMLPGVDNRTAKIKKGDRVLYGKWSGTEVRIGGDDLLIMKESDILGIVE